MAPTLQPTPSLVRYETKKIASNSTDHSITTDVISAGVHRGGDFENVS